MSLRVISRPWRAGQKILIPSATDWQKNTSMSQYKLEITDLAEEDMEELTDYIASKFKDPFAALKTLDRIREVIASLRQWPERHELDRNPELASRGIRRIYYRNYKIYYIVGDSTVKILRVLHMLVDGGYLA